MQVTRQFIEEMHDNCVNNIKRYGGSTTAFVLPDPAAPASEALRIADEIDALDERMDVIARDNVIYFTLKETSGAKALLRVELAVKALEDAEAALLADRASRTVHCSCGSYHALNELHLIVTQWYDENTGSPNGGYWKNGEWQFVCPSDGTRNRILFDDYDIDWKDRGKVGVAAGPTFHRIFRRAFKSIDTVEDDKLKGREVINKYIDNNRAKFELPARKVKP